MACVVAVSLLAALAGSNAFVAGTHRLVIGARATEVGAAKPALTNARGATGSQSWGCLALLLVAALRPAKSEKKARALVRCVAQQSPLVPVVPVAPCRQSLVVQDLIDIQNVECFQVRQVVASNSSVASAAPEAARSTARTCSAARLVGGTRRSASRGARSASARNARRHVGAKCMERHFEAPVAPSFDSSRLRLQVQVGVCTLSGIRAERSREGMNHVVKGIAVLADARIQEKYIVETCTSTTSLTTL